MMVKLSGIIRTARIYMDTSGMTLVEVLLSAAIFAFLFGAILLVMTASDLSWKTGQNKLTEQQEARRVMDTLVRQLRQSKPEWVTIEASGQPNRDKVLFYEPVYNETICAGTIPCAGLWVIVKPDPGDQRKLIRKREDGNWETIAQGIESIRFGGGCAGCASYVCSPLAQDCPVIKIDINSTQGNGFNLTTYVTLRNNNMGGGGGAAPPPPGEGEF